MRASCLQLSLNSRGEMPLLLSYAPINAPAAAARIVGRPSRLESAGNDDCDTSTGSVQLTSAGAERVYGQSQPVEAPPGPSTAAMLRVLLVEDSDADAQLIVIALRRTGRVIEFERVQTAEAMRAAHPASWDLIISDWSLPGFSAQAALEIQKEIAPRTPFIIVSGTIGEDIAVEAMRGGARDFLLKDKLARLGPVVDREVRDAGERARRRVAEDALHESEARLRRLAHSEELLAQSRRLNAELEDHVRERTASLSATLKEREVLLQEVHHRVKNNLQVISSLINMQLRRVVDEASREALRECRSRVRAMALIHERLYQSSDYSRVPFAGYARKLAADVLRATSAPAANVSLDLSLEELSLPVDQAIPCGLILNELISNAQKHGFRDGRAGTIGVEFARIDGGRIGLTVWNDGIPCNDADILVSHSLGMQLVFTLAEQLTGNVKVSTATGTRFELTFPAEVVRE